MLSLTPLSGIPIIKWGDNLSDIITESIKTSNILIANNDILVITQKIVSKSEGRQLNLSSIHPSNKAIEISKNCDKDSRLVELILLESKSILRLRPGTIIVEHRLGFICANAGIDHSNVTSNNINDLNVLLLPENPDLTSEVIRNSIFNSFGKKVGVLIIDSHGRPWRLGVTGVSIGFSGLPGLVDMRGKPDMFGNPLQTTQIGVVDELAAAASLVMGQADESNPVIHVRGFPYQLRDGSFQEIIRSHDQDLFR